MDLRPVELGDRKAFEECCSSPEHIGTECSFADIYCWRREYDYTIAFEEGFCLIKGRDTTPEGPLPFYYYPKGKGDIRGAIEKLLSEAESCGHPCLIACMSRNEAEELRSLFPHRFEFFEDRDNSDYVYRREALATLTGKKYHAKRNFINRFTAAHPDMRVERISPANAHLCVEVCRQWCEEISSSAVTEFDLEAVTEAMDCFDSLGLFGVLVRVGDKPVAFSVASAPNKDLFITHFEKALSDYSECYAVVNNEMAKAFPTYEYVNREEDMGIEGLRKAKLSYHPQFMVEKLYAVERKDG